jgi:hypothetical protein
MSPLHTATGTLRPDQAPAAAVEQYQPCGANGDTARAEVAGEQAHDGAPISTSQSHSDSMATREATPASAHWSSVTPSALAS